MAIAKKGARKIEVDGVEYRWTIRSKPTYSEGAYACNMSAAVELADANGAVLSIHFPWPRPDNWLDKPATAVTPQHIEACIRGALAKGWVPEEKGSAFVFDYQQ